MDLKRRHNLHFCRGDSPCFWSKSWSYIVNKPFWTTKTSVSNTHKIVIFSKEVSPKIWNFVLCKIHVEKVFGDVLVRKQAFLDNMNLDLKNPQNWHFCKGVSPWFWSKSLSFFYLLYLSKKNRERVFADVQHKKRSL